MAKKIGYIEKDGVIFVSVKDVFEYFREMEVITTEQLEWQYRWDFEQNLIKRMYNGYKMGNRSGDDIPWIIDGEFYAHWLRFEFTDFTKVIKTLRNEKEIKKIAMLIDFHDFARSKLFVKRKLAIK
ncbi:hypothetical protein [uncultured Bacteroides sp.]|jgi:hypothetical protein|uniref:hypothetical protein n=1 Tax=uncultured Bacteroides sp. TaxID=162156 RepID=UPI0026070B29|nr:hypothetical protein [uncultured Bacteroides sp.]